MPSPHRFLANDRNAALGATLSASSILPAEATAFPQQTIRQGSARAALTGGYIGPDDTLIDVEIVSAAGTGLLSQPVFSGAGNGTLTELSATGVASQTFTLLLASTGIPTKRATVDFYGVKLQAKASGAAGNGIRLTVSSAGLTATASVYSFLEPAKAGDSQFKGPQWDFGAYQLTADGEIDARTPRLRFGFDPQIYRQYKKFTDGEWRYTLDPPLVRELPAETKVTTITGGYTVTVTAGATVETYPGIVTLFDLLNALKTRSNLIEVVGVVVEDKTPGGMAAEDLPLRTDAYALPATYAGGAAFPGLGATTVPSTAPTEIITLTCKDITTLGAEVWSVNGSVSAALGECSTGVLYRRNGYEWTVPKVMASATTPSAKPTGKIYVKDISFAARKEGEKGFDLCVNPLAAGALAKAKTVDLVYSKKPTKDCPCDGAPSAWLNEKCLGVEINGSGGMAIPDWYKTRLIALDEWLANFATTNTTINTMGSLVTAALDIDLARKARDLLCGCLDDLYKEFKTADPPTTATDFWDTTRAGLATDLAQLAQLQAEPTLGVTRWLARGTYAPGTDVLPPESLATGHSYRIMPDLVQYQPDGLLKPLWYSPTQWNPTDDVTNWPTNGSSVNVSGLSTLSVNGQSIVVPGTAAIIDLGPYGTADNTLTTDPATRRRSVEAFIQRYDLKMNVVRARAGLSPKSDASSTTGSDCWQECEGDFEWRVNGLEYLPACTNQPYHSSVKKTDAKGNEVVVSTQEFGFVIRCACPDRLREGDKITIVIENDAAGTKTYAVGDTIKLPMIAGAALELAGGQTGNDTLTWTVRGSLGAAWPEYAAPIGTEPLYDQTGLKFRLKQGGIPFALGDQFTFSVAGGTWRWRRDGGSWSAAAAIPTGPTVLADGLSLTLLPGPAPAFVAGDTWRFDVKQPHAPKLARLPDRTAWRWSGAGADWTATFAADTPIRAVSVWHDCPAGATFTIVGLNAANGVLWSKVIPYRAGLAVIVLEESAAVAACRTLRLTVANATGGSIKWVWCGTPWAPESDADQIILRETWQMRSGSQTARWVGRGAAGEISWSADQNAWLESADWDTLLGLIDYAKSRNDQPLVFIPNAAQASSARLVRIATNALDFDDWLDFQRLPECGINVKLPLEAVTL